MMSLRMLPLGRRRFRAVKNKSGSSIDTSSVSKASRLNLGWLSASTYWMRQVHGVLADVLVGAFPGVISTSIGADAVVLEAGKREGEWPSAPEVLAGEHRPEAPSAVARARRLKGRSCAECVRCGCPRRCPTPSRPTNSWRSNLTNCRFAKSCYWGSSPLPCIELDGAGAAASAIVFASIVFVAISIFSELVVSSFTICCSGGTAPAIAVPSCFHVVATARARRRILTARTWCRRCLNLLLTCKFEDAHADSRRGRR